MKKDLLLWLSFLILTLTGHLSFASGELDGKGLICKSDDWDNFFWSEYDGYIFVNGSVITHSLTPILEEGGTVELTKMETYEYQTNETQITWGNVIKYCENPSSLSRRFSCWMDKPEDDYYLTSVDRRTLKKVSRSKLFTDNEVVYTSQCEVAETETIYFQMLERRRLEHQQKIQRYLDSRKI